MAIFLQNQGEHNGIHDIKPDIRADIMECVQNVKHSGTPDGIKAAERLERFIKLYNETEIEQEAYSEIVDNLTPEQEEKIKEAHAQDYHGTDDDMPDAYESWLTWITSAELKKILGL